MDSLEYLIERQLVIPFAVWLKERRSLSQPTVCFRGIGSRILVLRNPPESIRKVDLDVLTLLTSLIPPTVLVRTPRPERNLRCGDTYVGVRGREGGKVSWRKTFVQTREAFNLYRSPTNGMHGVVFAVRIIPD